MITYRLADALPAKAVHELRRTAKTVAEHRMGIEYYLDAGHGSCLLRRPEVAALVVDNWWRFDSIRYQLVAWVVMPNHVHVVAEIKQGHPLSRTVHGWKSYTAKQISRYTGQHGRIWQADYWDRMIRNEVHLAAAVEYIEENPVAAGLVCAASEWPWSSANAAGGPPALPDGAL